MVTRHDTSAGRFYRRDGLRSILTGTEDWPSVTHILSVIHKPALVPWAANLERELVTTVTADLYEQVCTAPAPLTRDGWLATVARRLTEQRAHRKANEQATQIGSQAHGLIEWASRKAIGEAVGPEPQVREEALWAYMAWEDWVKRHDVKPVRIEQVVWSNAHGYAGTMDLLAYVEGKLALVDYKTGKQVYEESYLQSAAYQRALIEMGHGRPEVGYIIRLPKLTSDPAFEVVEVPPAEELLPVFLAACQLWSWWWAADQRSKAAWAARKRERVA